MKFQEGTAEVVSEYESFEARTGRTGVEVRIKISTMLMESGSQVSKQLKKNGSSDAAFQKKLFTNYKLKYTRECNLNAMMLDLFPSAVYH